MDVVKKFWTVEQQEGWERNKECTRCHSSLSWEGDLPESEEDAICFGCAMDELDDLRTAVFEQQPLRIQKSRK